jgi:hypothetical protein
MMMEIFGTTFTLTLGSWKFRFCVAIDDVDAAHAAPATTQTRSPHHIRVVPAQSYESRRN